MASRALCSNDPHSQAACAHGGALAGRASAPRALGKQLLAAFEHLTVLSLERSTARRDQIGRLLREHFGLQEGRDYGFSAALDCDEYGGTEWIRSARAVLAHAPAMRGGGGVSPWWLRREACNETAPPRSVPRCLSTEHVACRRSALDEGGVYTPARRCGAVCYSLSVAKALGEFVRSNRSRMLLLEDDACATAALGRASHLLARLAEHASEWSLVKLGHCWGEPGEADLRRVDYGFAPGLLSKVERMVAGVTEAPDLLEVEGTCAATRETGGQPNGMAPASQYQLKPLSSVSLMRTLGVSFCAHALAMDRKGAERLLKLAFPVADIFDNLLMDLGGGSEQSQQEAIELLGLDSEKDLKAFHFMPAVFVAAAYLKYDSKKAWDMRVLRLRLVRRPKFKNSVITV
ncbi:hypothetical protein AB1Y20_004150 [Prymnesium parvum]|uniref:Queuosine salvage protein n=1 Tax=Prymnesium parvum TaxID=97485 RepID=A0AB34J963_PRYPA